jgi:Transglutaminase-like superfamily
MTRLVKFWRLARREKESLCEAAIFLSLANVCVRTISFKHIDKYLRAHCNDRAQRAIGREQGIAVVQRSISRAANTLPWTSLCLSRSIAEFMMLRRRGIPAVLCAGVRADRASLVAHAWVETATASSDTGYATVIRIGTEARDPNSVRLNKSAW